MEPRSGHDGRPTLETPQTMKKNLPAPPPPDCSHARSDLSLTEATLPKGMLGDGKNGLELWQDNIPFPRLIPREERKWAILPCTSQAGPKNWLLQCAMETLRHENLHDPQDGAISFFSFYKHMTRKAWVHNRDECKRVCRSPLHLIQALIAATPTPTLAAAWWFDLPPFDDLKGSRYGHIPLGR